MDMEKVEKLIEIVRGHVFLYDLGHPQYKNACLKSEVWESIGRELDESCETVRNKWKTVRDGYTKYKKQLKTSTGSGRPSVNYTWSSALAFLDNINMPRASSSTVAMPAIETSSNSRAETPEIDSSTQSSTSSSPQLPQSSQVLPSESPANTSMSSTSRGSWRNNKRLKRSLYNRRDDDNFEKVLQYINAVNEKENDVIDNLFLSYADTFKNFPPREQVNVKLELAKLFTDIELQLLDNSYY